MTKAKIERRIIKWNPRASTRVRDCAVPYDLGPIYQPGKVDQWTAAKNFKEFHINNKTIRGVEELDTCL